MSKSTSFTNYIIALLTIYVIEFMSAVGSSLVANVLGNAFAGVGFASILAVSW